MNLEIRNLMKLCQKIGLICCLTLSAATAFAASGQMTTLAISAGDSDALALRSDGSVWSWGTNQFGEMGISNLTCNYYPMRVVGVSNVSKISAGEVHSLAIETNGTVWAWGDNSGGELGNTNGNSPVPV